MRPLDSERKRLLFDYCMGLTSPEQDSEVDALISSNKEAAKIHSRLKAVLEPLESVESEICPDYLVEQTMQRIDELSASGQKQLQNLLATEQAKKTPVKIGFWRNFSEMAAVAAAVIFIIAVLVPTMGVARQKYIQKRCQMQLGSIFQGFSYYIDDHNGQQPAVATADGSPWYKVGDQGDQNHSNTRHIYLLVKYDYVDLNDFVCPGSDKARIVYIEPSLIRTYRDFPNRNYVTYSFRISCSSTKHGKLSCRKVIMADLNPLFEELPEDFSKPFNVSLDRKSLTLNSINHKRHGQNVLFGDGSVEFSKTRNISIAGDDIFTLQDTDIYRGSEVPSITTDSFLAP